MHVPTLRRQFNYGTLIKPRFLPQKNLAVTFFPVFLLLAILRPQQLMITAAHDRTLAASSSVVGWNLRFLLLLSTHNTTELEGKTSALTGHWRNAEIYGIPSQVFEQKKLNYSLFFNFLPSANTLGAIKLN